MYCIQWDKGISMTQTAWAHLPNAKHIDWVIASLKANPEMWVAAWRTRDAARYAAWNAARVAAFDAAWNTAGEAARGAAWGAAWDATRVAAFDAAWNTAGEAARCAATDAIAALVAYDDCAYMIESEVGELKIIAAFGDQKAVLLLPACIVYNETKELV